MNLTLTEARVLHRILKRVIAANDSTTWLNDAELGLAVGLRDSIGEFLRRAYDEHNTLTMWCDGAARPSNPGPAGIGIIGRMGDRTVLEVSEYVGKTTNNVAEYMAAIEALRRAIDIGAQRVILHTDSQLVAKQYSGEWDCREEHLKPLLGRLRGLAQRLDYCELKWIPRQQNREADGLSVAGAYTPRTCGACQHDFHLSFCTEPSDEEGKACACPHGFKGGLQA